MSRPETTALAVAPTPFQSTAARIRSLVPLHETDGRSRARSTSVGATPQIVVGGADQRAKAR